MIKTLACTDCDTTMGEEGDRQVCLERAAFDKHQGRSTSASVKRRDTVEIDKWISSHLYSALLIMFSSIWL